MMNTFLKNFLISILMGGTLIPAFAYAAESSSTATQTLVNQLQSVQNELNALRTQQGKQGSTATVVPGLVSQLHEGSTGPEVRILQALLATDPSIYPEGIVSGYYGQLTADAVARFQKKNGLSQVGFVGPHTLAALQALLNRPPMPEESAVTSIDATNTEPPCTVVPATHLIAPTWLFQNTAATSSVILECTNISPALYSRLVGGTATAAVSSTSDDHTAPQIWGVEVTKISGTTSVLVSWHTDELATSRVAYVEAGPGAEDFSVASSTGSSELTLDHEVTVAGLLPSRMYHFMPGSLDAAGNTATTSSRVLVTSSL